MTTVILTIFCMILFGLMWYVRQLVLFVTEQQNLNEAFYKELKTHDVVIKFLSMNSAVDLMTLDDRISDLFMPTDPPEKMN